MRFSYTWVLISSPRIQAQTGWWSSRAGLYFTFLRNFSIISPYSGSVLFVTFTLDGTVWPVESTSTSKVAEKSFGLFPRKALGSGGKLPGLRRGLGGASEAESGYCARLGRRAVSVTIRKLSA